jgi:DNA invertase Pin-like site-specific DNA recombinase
MTDQGEGKRRGVCLRVTMLAAIAEFERELIR